MGKNKKSCPITGDIYEGGQGTPQDIGVNNRFPNLCGQDFQVDDSVPQESTSEY